MSESRRLQSTTSICPTCKLVLPAELLERDGRVLLSRSCPEHGLFEAVVSFVRAEAIEERLRGARLLGIERPAGSPLDVSQAIELMRLAGRAIAAGSLGYVIVAARAP